MTSPMNSPTPTDPSTAVKWPGLSLVIVGSLGIVALLIGILLVLLGVGMGAMQGGNGGMANMAGGVFGIVIRLFFIVLDGVIVYGGMKMQKLQSYNLAMAAAVLAVVPCVSPCCIVGIPFGIWALIVLLKPEVKAAFTA